MEKLILEIMKVALEKNSKERNTIWVRFSGHVNWLDVSVCTRGYDNQEIPDWSKTIYLYKDNAKEKLQETLDYLKDLED